MAVLFGNVYLDAFAIIVTFLAVVVGFFLWAFTFWRRKGVYTLSPVIPFGNAADLVFQKESFATELKRNYDEFKKRGLRYGGFYFFSKPIFIPVDLDLIKAMMTTDFAHFTNRIFFSDTEAEPLTGHIIFLKGLKWKQMRAKLDPSFTPSKIKMMFQTVLDCTKELMVVVDDAVRKGEIIDAKQVISGFMIDVIGSSAFGIECNSLTNPNSEFRKYGRMFFDTSFWGWFVRMISIMTPELLNYFKFRTVHKKITDFFMNVVKETVNYREKNKVFRNDILQLLIQLKNNGKANDVDDEEEISFKLNDIAAQCFGFFIAGFETATTATCFCLYELAKNPEIQDKLRKEINTVLAKHEGKITYDSMMKMTYLDQCVNETLRKYPPIPMYTRQCTKTYRVPDSEVVIEKDTFVFIPTFAVHHDPEFYPDPDKFDPERFSEEGKASLHPSSWMPFADGPRICIGLRLGEIQMKVALIVLLKDYKFALSPKTPLPLGIDPKMLLVTCPKEQIMLYAKKTV